MPHYVAILDGADGAWGVSVPDLPGCYGGGQTPEAAMASAASAVADYAAYRTSRGETMAPPRPLAAILADPDSAPDTSAGEVTILIPVVMDEGRNVRASISLDAGLLAAIDHNARMLGITRSAFIAAAARDKLGVTSSPSPPRDTV